MGLMAAGASIGILMLLFWLGSLFCFGYMWWRIVKKTGYHGALGILMMVPIANIVMMAILAFKEWPIEKEYNTGEAQPSKISTPLIVVIAAVCILPVFFMLAAIAIPNFLRAKISANDAVAKSTVRVISAAMETYNASNHEYPSSEYDLKKSGYISEYYDKNMKNGYVYSYHFMNDGYEITATPQTCGTTGMKVITAKTNGDVSEVPCAYQGNDRYNG